MARVWTTLAILGATWAVSFNVTTLPFFPTVLVGAGLAGGAGWWIRRLPAPPPLRLSPTDAAIALTVAGAHFLLGHLLFDAVAALAPALVDSATAIYERTAQTPLVARLVLAGVVTAPLEEVYWRGAVQPTVTHAGATNPNRSGPHPGRDDALRGFVLSTLVYTAFTAVTLQPALIAAAALGGLVWGGLLLATGSAGAPMLAHGCWTALMILFPPV